MFFLRFTLFSFPALYVSHLSHNSPNSILISVPFRFWDLDKMFISLLLYWKWKYFPTLYRFHQMGVFVKTNDGRFLPRKQFWNFILTMKLDRNGVFGCKNVNHVSLWGHSSKQILQCKHPSAEKKTALFAVFFFAPPPLPYSSNFYLWKNAHWISLVF